MLRLARAAGAFVQIALVFALFAWIALLLGAPGFAALELLLGLFLAAKSAGNELSDY